jgi:hypothetical protein
MTTLSKIAEEFGNPFGPELFNRDPETDPGVVTRAGFRVAEGPLSQQREHARVSRLHGGASLVFRNQRVR